MIKLLKSLFKAKRRKAYWTTYPMYADNENQKVEFMEEVWEEMQTKIKIKKKNYE